MSTSEIKQVGVVPQDAKATQSGFESCLRTGTETEQLDCLNTLFQSAVTNPLPLRDQTLTDTLVRLVPKIRVIDTSVKDKEKTYLILSRLSPQAAAEYVNHFIFSEVGKYQRGSSVELSNQAELLGTIAQMAPQKPGPFREAVFNYIWQEASNILSEVSRNSTTMRQEEVMLIIGTLRWCFPDKVASEADFIKFLSEKCPSALHAYQDYLGRLFIALVQFDSTLLADGMYHELYDFNKRMIEFEEQWRQTTIVIKQLKPQRFKTKQQDMVPLSCFKETFETFFQRYLTNGHGTILELVDISKKLRLYFSIPEHPYTLDDVTLSCFEEECRHLYGPTHQILISALPIIDEQKALLIKAIPH